MFKFKQVQINQPASTNLYFSVYSHIKSYNCLPKDISKTKLNYYVSQLKKAKFIEKKGYGVWEVISNFDILKLKQVQTSTKKITRSTPPQPVIRGHAFQFTIRLPKIARWKERRIFLTKKKIPFLPMEIFGSGERIFFKGKKIWLTDKSLIIFEKNSFLSDTAKGSKNYAIYEMLETLKSLENLFDISFKINKQYKFKVSKQHYARLQCELAKQYREDGKKLSIKQEDGTAWLWIDYSLNIDETETGNTERSDLDMDKHIHPFLNSLRKVEGYTPEFVINSLGSIIKYEEKHAKNISSHIRAIQRLGVGVEDLRKEIKNLKKKIGQTKLNNWM